MLGAKFEEYIKFDGGLPFMFNPDITRTSTFYTRQANWHDNLEIQLYTAGVGSVQLDEKSVGVSEDDFVVVNSNVIHHTRTSISVTYDCMIFDNNFCGELGIDVPSTLFESRFKSDVLKGLFAEMKQLISGGESTVKRAQMYDVAIRILICLALHHTRCRNLQKAQKKEYETLKNAIRYVRENYMNKIYLDDIALAVFTDKYALSRLFKKCTGQTPVQYVNAHRCRKAAEYISQGKTVSEAALLCGFSNMSFFTKTFKSYFGMLPSNAKKTRQ